MAESGVHYRQSAFLGGQMMRSIGEEYTLASSSYLASAVPSDSRPGYLLVREGTNAILQSRQVRSAGLVATNMIRGGSNRPVWSELLINFEIFDAWSDEPWTVDGADVRVSIVCFWKQRKWASTIGWGNRFRQSFDDLTAGESNLTAARPLT